MAHDASIGSAAHPAPYRDRTTLWELTFAVLAPPLAWSIHLVLNYAFASHSCFPDGTPQAAPSLRALRVLLLAVDGASLLISAIAVLIAYRAWQVSAQEMADIAPPLVETGEGRTRFLAVWGLLIGIGFFVAVLFDFVGLWILPPCG
jgi:hypothetical protein